MQLFRCCNGRMLMCVCVCRCRKFVYNDFIQPGDESMIFIGGARALRILLIHTVHGLFVALMSDRSTMRQFRAVCACAHMVING